MTKHEIKNCPRCHTTFECKVGDIVRCQCSAVAISRATKDYLEKTEYDCLCKKCLFELNQMITMAEKHRFPRQSESMVENLHYYKENGWWVFTEFYHLLRGYCCKNGCRHCAYGYKKMSLKE